jgi:class 3 adenylate cyclase
MKMRGFTLAFEDPALEREYLASRTRRWSTFAIGGGVYALVFQPLAGWIGARMLGHARLFWTATFAFVMPLVLASIFVPLVLPRPWRARAIRLAPAAAVFVIMFWPTILITEIGAPVMPFATLGLSLTIGVLYTGLGLRFVHGVVATWVLVAAYLGAMIARGDVPAIVIGHAVLWLATAEAFGMQQGYAEERSRRRIFLQKRTIEEERAKSERLLKNMLPEAIAERLKTSPGAIADGHEAVSVLFADIAGFTPMSAKMSPEELVRLLNEIFSTFDGMAAQHGLEKIKTIGDAYMVVGGVPAARPDHATAVAAMALEMREATARFGLQMRIGAHTGPAVAGVIGTAKYSYDLWGDTVNTASRMESHGAPGRIHISDEFRAALGDRWKLEERGVVEIKGKGPMKTWWLDSASP